ncbi:MAG: TetR family transcriptional regulator [Actinobacteria bacterium]|nr:TetR family transcriptional regulator [Actinomycetota bacterium]MCB9390100.1 TetR family transcriptional regulator [Acidimicrobiia bacterium]
MARKIPQLTIDSVLAEMSGTAQMAERDVVVLRCVTSLMDDSGLRGWTIDDVVNKTNVGRTTLYRRFGDRDDLVHAALAFEISEMFPALARRVRDLPDVAERVVEGLIQGVALVRRSMLGRLLDSDPEHLIPLFSVEAGPLMAVAIDSLAAVAAAESPELPMAQTRVVGEVLIRLALSAVLTPTPTSLWDGTAESRARLTSVVRSLLTVDLDMVSQRDQAG